MNFLEVAEADNEVEKEEAEKEVAEKQAEEKEAEEQEADKEVAEKALTRDTVVVSTTISSIDCWMRAHNLFTSRAFPLMPGVASPDGEPY